MKLSTLWLFGLALLISACSLAGDVTPPPGSNVQRPVVNQPSGVPAVPDTSNIDVSAAVPAQRPSAEAGGAIYAQRCAECHGLAGQSDGTRVAQLPAPPPKFSEAETLRNLSPREVYGVVTLGRLEKFMPPFVEALSDTERWDVVAYLYTLGVPPAQVAEGEALYTANCAECHGVDGAQVLDWTRPDYFAGTSPAQAFKAITSGVENMPDHAFAPRLSDDARWAITNFSRSLTVARTAASAPVAELTGTVIGQVANGTANAGVPEGLVISLLGFTETSMAETISTTADASGHFTFDTVPFVTSEQFILTTEYDGIIYHSEVFGFSEAGKSVQMPLAIYEAADNTAHIQIEQLHTFLIFDTPGEVTIGQMALVSNKGDTTFAPTNGQGVKFPIPPGAQEVFAPEGVEGESYFVTPEGYVDARPIPPGQGTLQVFYQYRLPYNGQLNFEQKLDYATTDVNLLVDDAHLSLTGAGLEDLGKRDMGGRTFQQFQRAGLPAGEALSFQLTGNVGTAAQTTATTLGLETSNTLNLGLGLGAVLAVAGAVALWWMRRQQAVTPVVANGQVSREDLLQALAELDDEYEAGRVTEQDYQKERAWLKARVKQVWQRG